MNTVPASGGYVPSPYNIVLAPKTRQVYPPSVVGGTPPLPTVVNIMPTPQATAEPALAQPAPAQPAPNPYTAFIEAMQQAQDKNSRALQEIVDQRQASQAVIRSMQASDATTVAAFEKLVRQMKEDSSPRTLIAPPAVNRPPVNIGTMLPAYPVPLRAPSAFAAPVVPASPAVPAAPKDMKALLQELEQLSQKVKELSSQISPRGE